MKVVTLLNVILIFVTSLGFSQNTIHGSFTGLGNQQVRLEGFNGFGVSVIDSTMSDTKGNFTLNYSKKDNGIAYLVAEDNKSFIVVLDEGEDLELSGEILAVAQNIKITHGRQNLIFGQYANEHPRREQALSAWDYLEKIYTLDPLFAVQEMPKQTILNEKQRIKDEDSNFLKGLDASTYLSWYLPVRKLVSSVSVVAQYRTSEIPATISSFRSIDYTDPRLYKSGLLRETIEAHVWLIENSGRSLDSVFIELNKSIDCIVDNTSKNEKLFNEITDFLFKLLEQRSLFTSSEYLALKVLNDKGCAVNQTLATQLESYRIMKKGNTAPDITFKGDIVAKYYAATALPKKLSDIKSKYTVIVFGASWCPACSGELTKISEVYNKWKQYGVEVIFVSLDEDKQAFKNFTANFPFISFCDYRKWESDVIKSYYVFGTPTIYLLDNNRQILLRPNSANQMDSWVDWFLVQGNINR